LIDKNNMDKSTDKNDVPETTNSTLTSSSKFSTITDNNDESETTNSTLTSS